MVLFFLMYLFSFYLVIGGSDWFMIWLGLEINMMMFIMIMFERYSMLNVESCLKYFFIQSLGSAIFMVLFYISELNLDFILCLVLSYKIGAGPFFYWFPSVCSGISWMSCFILMSIQKMIPLVLMSMFVSWVFFIVIMMSLVFGVFGSFNQKSLKPLMAYSSIYHLGWILLCVLIGSNYWFFYMIMYMFMIFPVIFFLMNSGVVHLMDVIKIKSSFWLVIVVLGMAGMPPFLGFFLKWFAFSVLMDYSVFFVVVLILCSVVMFYVYFRVIYDVLMSYYYFSGWGSWIFGNSSFWLDVLCMIGMLLGIGVGIYLVL